MRDFFRQFQLSLVLIFSVFGSATHTALLADCNSNGVPDAEDIQSGASSDCNENLVPDDCELAPLELGLGSENYPIEFPPHTVLGGDFDADGRRDLLVIQSGSETRHYEIFLGREGQSLERLDRFSLDTGFSAMTSADFDADGDTDLLGVTNNQVAVIENLEDGDFAEPRFFPTPSDTTIAVSDVTGDGRPDVLTTSRIGGHRLNVLVQTEDGGLAEAVSYVLGGQVPRALAVGDLDGDSVPDAATLDFRTQTISLMFNLGDGSFAEAATLPLEPGSSVLSIADLDNDGAGELIVGVPAGKLLLYFSEGGGAFDAPVEVSAFPRAIHTQDMDGDADLDLVINGTDNRIAIFTNAGQRRFLPAGDVPAESVFLTPGDLDGDGSADLGFVSDEPLRVEALFNGLRDRVRFDSVRTLLGEASKPHQIAVGDFDADGLPDVVTANSFHKTYTLAFGRGDGSFDRIRNVPLDQSKPLNGRSWARTVDTGDVDGDGDVDFVFGDITGSNVSVVKNVGGGEFADPVPYWLLDRARPTYSPHNLKLADIDGDGDLDVFVVGNPNGAITFRNDGTGVLVDPVDMVVGKEPFWVTDADLDGDGDVDFALSDRAGMTVFVFFNEGNGLFDRIDSYDVPANPHMVNTSDLDVDGDLDLLVANGKSVSVFAGLGDGRFADPTTYFIDRLPYSVMALDVDSDGILDIATGNELTGSVSVLTGNGDASFESPFHIPAGEGARHVLTHDLDADGDLDILAGNRTLFSLTSLMNPGAASDGLDVDFLESVCTPLEYHGISSPSRFAPIRRSLKFLSPAIDVPELLPTIYQNTTRFNLHQEFLAEVFPERFPALSIEEYNDLVNRRATRQYYAGVIALVNTSDGPVYGFNILVDTSDLAEFVTQEEVQSVYETLRQTFQLEPFGYFPQSTLEREIAAGWVNADFPIFTASGSVGNFQAYTRGVAYGRARVLDREGFDAANEAGQLSFQDILVLDHAPRDVEGVISALVTADPQTENSHTFIRMAIRNTPNCFLKEPAKAFERLSDGDLIRLEITERGVSFQGAELEEAQAFWEANRPRLTRPPTLDPMFTELSTLDEIVQMELSGETQLVARFGGKATNLARLRRLFDTPEHRQYQEQGFAIPVHYYLEFMKSNQMPSALDPNRLVSYEKYLEELFQTPEFLSDSALRFEALDDLRDHMRDEGVVDPALVTAVINKVAEVMGTASNVRVRFRSSSNMEDDVQFNGAGLYNSTSGCPEDELDADDAGPSHCDPTRDEERGVARALKRVWRSLWNFKAYEERAFFGIDQEIAAMAVLVNRTFIDEAANGVAFTGNVSNVQDRRYIITVQAGEESVVSPEPGVRAEKDLLTVEAGVVSKILRGGLSTLVPPGEVVLTDAQLTELGELMWFIDQNFPVATGDFSREEVLLDMEFKFMPDGELAIKQVRPFLLKLPPVPTPTFELEVPPGTEVCGVYRPFDSAREAYARKSVLRFRQGLFPLTSSELNFELDLIEELRYGPGEELAVADGVGSVELLRIPESEDVTRYSFRYAQSFTLSSGVSIEVTGQLDLFAEGEDVLDEGRLVLDESFFTVAPRNELFVASVDGLPAVHYGSCGFSTLRRLEVRAEFEDGAGIVLQERLGDEADREFRGAAAVLESAIITYPDGDTSRVDDYYQRVYAAPQHNDPVDYLMVLDSATRVSGVEGEIFALEFLAPPVYRLSPNDRPGELLYLDANLSPLKRVTLGTFSRAEVVGIRFRRGDVQADGSKNIADALYLLERLYRRGPEIPCRKAADLTDDGRLNLADAIAVLEHIFRGGAPLPEPSENCGVDAIDGLLSCDAFPPCE